MRGLGFALLVLINRQAVHQRSIVRKGSPEFSDNGGGVSVFACKYCRPVTASHVNHATDWDGGAASDIRMVRPRRHVRGEISGQPDSRDTSQRPCTRSGFRTAPVAAQTLELTCDSNIPSQRTAVIRSSKMPAARTSRFTQNAARLSRHLAILVLFKRGARAYDVGSDSIFSDDFVHPSDSEHARTIRHDRASCQSSDEAATVSNCSSFARAFIVTGGSGTQFGVPVLAV